MKPALSKGQLIRWNDERGFGFIQPSSGGKEVFLHISALQRSSRRPKVGDTILFEQTQSAADGKLRAARASIDGVPQSAHKSTSRSTSRTKTLVNTRISNRTAKGVVGLAALVIVGSFTVITEFSAVLSRGQTPSPVTSIVRPECTIKGNISMNSGNRVYHLPGMEDYVSTVIDESQGEKWFCSEQEAIANGWHKAPR